MIRRALAFGLAATAFATSAFAEAPPPPGPATNHAFQTWITEFRSTAEKEGFEPAFLDTAFKDLEYRHGVITSEQFQPEFVRPIWEYLDAAASARRVERGRELAAGHEQLLDEIESRYGVSSEILLAIWGIESAYGANLGSYSVVEALATLAFAGRRQDFAERELLAALAAIQESGVEPRAMRGSWAGAFGHTQFLPTSYLEYAVDFDGDGRRDLWSENPADALASTANYLARNGWRSDVPWGAEARLPSGFDYRLAARGNSQPLEDWRRLGVSLATGEPLASWVDERDARVILPAGAYGPAFVATGNFGAILRYNNATSYALAVGSLADLIAYGPTLRAKWPRLDPALRIEEIVELQARLVELGHDAGEADGIIGPSTRGAVRDFQEQAGLIPDGYVSAELIRMVRRAAEDR